MTTSDELAVAHRPDLIAPLGDVRVVCHKHDRLAVLLREAGQQIENDAGIFLVEISGRLVREQD